jgi:hypothetical protein
MDKEMAKDAKEGQCTMQQSTKKNQKKGRQKKGNLPPRKLSPQKCLQKNQEAAVSPSLKKQLNP